MSSSLAQKLRGNRKAVEALTPPLKWAGGKRWLLPILRDLYEPYADRRLVEPFVGGMAVALGLQPKQALLADINPHLVNFYRCLQSGLRVSTRMRNDRETYLKIRARFNHAIRTKRFSTEEAAGFFYYLNRTGFNGLCRFNSDGIFNVPFGRYSTISYTKDFALYRAPLRRWKFRCGDFEELSLKEGDFIYADPPYDVQFTRYAQRDFDWEDQVRLAHWLRRHRGPVVASNQASDRIVGLYRDLGFTLRLLPAPRMISCNGDRTPAQEILAVRNISAVIRRRVGMR